MQSEVEKLIAQLVGVAVGDVVGKVKEVLKVEARKEVMAEVSQFFAGNGVAAPVPKLNYASEPESSGDPTADLLAVIAGGSLAPKEIAARLGITPAAASKRLERALAKKLVRRAGKGKYAAGGGGGNDKKPRTPAQIAASRANAEKAREAAEAARKERERETRNAAKLNAAAKRALKRKG